MAWSKIFYFRNPHTMVTIWTAPMRHSIATQSWVSNPHDGKKLYPHVEANFWEIVQFVTIWKFPICCRNLYTWGRAHINADHPIACVGDPIPARDMPIGRVHNHYLTKHSLFRGNYCTFGRNWVNPTVYMVVEAVRWACRERQLDRRRKQWNGQR